MCKGSCEICKNQEISDRTVNGVVSLQPRLLLCLRCRAGGGASMRFAKDDANELAELFKREPDTCVRLETAFDEVGGRTELYDATTPEERKRDLDVLCRLGLVPGDERTARDLFSRIDKQIPNLDGICRYDANQAFIGTWDECPVAHTSAYEKGKGAVITWKRTQEEMLAVKSASCRSIEENTILEIRAHHLLCIACFISRDDNDKPIEEDNLYEAWIKIKNKPKIPVKILEGPGECVVCPPCPGYRPDFKMCVAACHLRDRKKDLETMLRLGVKPGDILPADELIARIYRYIPDNDGICRLNSPNSFEWGDCNGLYKKGLEKGYLPPAP